MAVEVSPGVRERQPSAGPPPHMRPSASVPQRHSGSAYGPRSMLGGLGTFSVVLGVVLLLVAGGLVAADRDMRDAAQKETTHDASESALQLRNRVALAMEALGGQRALFVSGDSATRARF